MADPLRNLYINNVLLECSLDEMETLAPDLKLSFVREDITMFLHLKRMSGTKWVPKETLAVPITASNYLVIVSSEPSRELGRKHIDLSDLPSNMQDLYDKEHQFQDVRFNVELEPSEDGSKLSFSFDLKSLVPHEFVVRLQADSENTDISELYVYIQLCVPDQSTKADLLNLCGDKFRDKFMGTRDEGDIRAAIKIYDEAVACLSEGDSRLPTFTGDLGMGYYVCYDTFGQMQDSQEAIRKLETAVEITSGDDTDLLRWLNELANVYLRRFERVGDLRDISEAIQLQQTAVKITPEGYEYSPILLNNLGASFFRRFERNGEVADIEEAIQLQQRAVELASDEGPYLPSILSDLGNSFLRRFEHFGGLEDISSAIKYQQRAIELAPEEHTKLSAFLDNLGASFMIRSERTGNLEDVEESIRLRRRAVQLTPEGHPNLPVRLSNLGNSFTREFERTGELADINEAIQAQQRAVHLTQEGHANLPALLSGLGSSFLRRFELKGDLTDISESIQLQQRAVSMTPEGHADLAAWLNNLGTSFLTRFESTGELADLDEAIQLQQRAVQLTPSDHADLPLRLTSLGTSLSRRFEQTRELTDISESISLQQQAIQHAAADHAITRILLNNLGVSFFHRFRKTGEIHDMSESIRVWERAVKLTPQSSPDLPAVLDNFGGALLSRFEQGGTLEDISESIRVRTRAIELASDGHADLPSLLNNLGASFLRLFDETNQQEAFTSALNNFRLSALSSSGPPSVCMIAAQNWASLSKKFLPSSPSQLLDAHERIIYLLTLITGLENTVKRRHELLLQSSQLSTAAAAAALSANRPDKALEFLEQGRCIVWAQINQLRTPIDDLRTQDPDMADRLAALSKQLENAGSRADPRQPGVLLSMDAKMSLQSEAHNHLRLAKERDELLASIRTIPGFENFLQPRKCSELMSKLPEEGQVVIINADKERCDALVLEAGRKEPVHIPLPKFSLLRQLRSRYAEDEVETRAIALAKPGPRGNLLGLLGALWADLVEPILQALAVTTVLDLDKVQDLKRIWWCPTGPFAFLPIHAAGVYTAEKEDSARGTCLADFAISSYIPTLSMLEGLKGRATLEPMNNRVLLISQPDTPGLSKIPSTVEEVRKTREELNKRGIDCTVYSGNEAKADLVLESLDSFSYVHLACHASQGLKDPLESAIHLYDRPLKLSQIIKKTLPSAEFAFMSACQTSAGAENLPEEAVHLAAGMLASGYRSVVATMWSISDRYAPQVAETFYQNLSNDGVDEVLEYRNYASVRNATPFLGTI